MCHQLKKTRQKNERKSNFHRTAEFCKRSKLVTALIVVAFKIKHLRSLQYQLMYNADDILFSLLFHFGVHIITLMTFVGAGSAKITLKMH